jgi:CRP/FNR family transcriptional regulator
MQRLAKLLESKDMIPRDIENALVRTFPVFRDLPESLRRSLHSSAQHVSVSAKTVLFEDGSPCRAFPLLLSGSVRVTKASSEGREMVLYRIAAGQFCLITTSCLLGKATYPARGITEIETELVLVDPAIFHQLLAQHDSFRTMVFGLFAERLAELMQLVEEVAFGQLDRRLAALLLSRGTQIYASHQDLADELGSVRVVVSRLLRNFEEQRWVSLGREHIRILAPGALKQLSDRNP